MGFDFVSAPAPLDFSLAPVGNTNADGTPPATASWIDSILSTAKQTAAVATTWKELVAPITAVQTPALGMGSGKPASTGLSQVTPNSILGSPYFLAALAVGFLALVILKKR